MKTIVCYGDSNTWGFIPATEQQEPGVGERFPPNVRWSGALPGLLGGEYRVIEEGLNGRTTAFNDVIAKYRNGTKYLGVSLMTNKPVDLLIIMLGGNDTKKQFLATSANIAKGMEKLIKIARSDAFGPGGGLPKILIIAPPHIREDGLKSWARLNFDQYSLQKSKELAEKYFDLARKNDCYYMNAAVYAKFCKNDGLHLDAKNHQKLANAVAVKVKEIFEEL